MSFFEKYKVLWVADAVACNAFTASDYVCCKNAKMVYFVCKHNGATDTDLTLGLIEATDVAAGTNAAVTATVPMWKDTDHGTTSDEAVRLTDAASDVIDPATEGEQLTFIQWDPAKHTTGYDCIAVSGSGGNASNTINIVAVVEMRYQEDVPPSVIVD